MTEEEISKLTVAEINILVTGQVYNVSHWPLLENKSAFYNRGIAGVTYQEVKVQDFCNKVNLMQLVMTTNAISILLDKSTQTYFTYTSHWDGWQFEALHQTYHTNPLRAAAITYLKLKGVL